MLNESKRLDYLDFVANNQDKLEKDEYKYFNQEHSPDYHKVGIDEFEHTLSDWYSPHPRHVVEYYYREYLKIPNVDLDEFMFSINLDSEKR